MGTHSLKTKHITALVKYWRTVPSKHTNNLISTGTIKNRMAALRWWADKIGKPGIIPKDNAALGIPNRQRLSDHNKAFTVTEYQLKNLPAHLNISVRLQQEFGLRREEAAKFIPAIAIKEDCIKLKSSWTKGGKKRSIPITTIEQRELLAEMKTLKQNDSLIPAGMSYEKYISHRDHHLAKVNIRQAHGLRYYYAQQRYITLSKGLVPPKLCKGDKVILTKQEVALDFSARTIVSKEMGHERLEITVLYLG